MLIKSILIYFILYYYYVGSVYAWGPITRIHIILCMCTHPPPVQRAAILNRFEHMILLLLLRIIITTFGWWCTSSEHTNHGLSIIIILLLLTLYVHHGYDQRVKWPIKRHFNFQGPCRHYTTEGMCILSPAKTRSAAYIISYYNVMIYIRYNIQILTVYTLYYYTFKNINVDNFYVYARTPGRRYVFKYV
jgi:hypothetical protein